MSCLLMTQPWVNSVECSPDSERDKYHDTKVIGLQLEVRKRGKTYYLLYRDERGHQRQKKLGRADILSLKDARAEAKQKLREIALGLNPFEAAITAKKCPTVTAFVLSNYLPHVKGYKRSWQTDECLLRNHILPAIGQLHMDEVKRHHIVSLVSKHRATHKPGSTNRVIILCRYIFNCAIKWEVAGVTKNPTAGIELYPENNKLERYLSNDEAKALFVELEKSENTQLKYIVAILLLTGARKREVLDARWDDFDLERRIWTVRVNKTGKPRYIPISDGLLSLFDQLPRFDECEWLVPNPDTLKPYVSIFGAWNTARTRAGLTDVKLHSLRHSFASFLINSGRSLYEVQKILGHTQVKTTQRYAHLSQDSLISAANTAIPSVPLIADMPKEASDVSLIEAQTETE